MTDINQQLGNLIASADALTEVVTEKVSAVNKAVNQAVEQSKSKVDGYIAGAEKQLPIYRQSKNQIGNVINGNLDYFIKNSAFNIEVSIYREINSGIEWEARDDEEKEIMRAMGLAGKQYFKPKIQVISMKWSGFISEENSGYTMYPNPVCSGSVLTTIASYAKLLNGSITSSWLKNVTNEWKICGEHRSPSPGGYIHAHPYVRSANGEVLFIWPAVVSGKVSLDPDKPAWGYYPGIFNDQVFETEVKEEV
ncbi:hypothetical protein WNY63_04985 [Pseudoalteromonas neustonica]|uniref:Uncharacterized protein n=1 Tax=Pseudoalteromonas neustonica TaxID=1840331 RepID=A0ABU9TZ67_9GAMM